MAGILDNINPVAIASNAIGKGVDVAAGESLNNTKDAQTSTTGAILTPQQQADLAPTSQIAADLPKTQEALKQIGANQEATVPQLEQGVSNIQAQLKSTPQSKQELDKSLNKFSDSMDQKQISLDSMQNELAQNPQAAVQKQYFGSASNSIMSSLAMALSGIGSGLTGQPNSAMEVFNNQIKRAIDQRSQNIEGYLKQSQQHQLSADQQMSKAQIAAMSRNIAITEINHGVAGLTEGLANTVKAKSGQAMAQVIIQKATQDAAQSAAQVTAPFVTNGTMNDASHITAMTQLLDGIHVGRNKSLQQQLQERSAQPQQAPIAQEVAPSAPAQPSQKKSFLEKIKESLGSVGTGGGYK